jgi:hypothetical protein
VKRLHFLAGGRGSGFDRRPCLEGLWYLFHKRGCVSQPENGHRKTGSAAKAQFAAVSLPRESPARRCRPKQDTAPREVACHPWVLLPD